MKLLEILILIGIVLISIEEKSAYEYGESIRTLTLNSSVCLNSGKILYGLVVSSASNITAEPVNGKCSNDSILLEPGVFINDQMVGSNGTCLISGVLVVGKAVSIGPTVDLNQNLTSGQLCSNSTSNVVILSPGVILISLSLNISSNEVLVVQNSPLLRNLKYNSTTINETICLESGVIINALISPSYNSTPKVYRSCIKGTIRVEPGVIVSQSNTMFVNVSCLTRGVVQTGRVLLTSSSNTIIPLGGNLTSGGVCAFNETENTTTNGVVFRPGVILLVPIESRQYEKYSKKDEIYSDYNKKSNKFDDIRKKYTNMIKEISNFKSAYMSYFNNGDRNLDKTESEKGGLEMFDDMQLYVNDGIGRLNIDNLEADIDIDVDFD